MALLDYRVQRDRWDHHRPTNGQILLLASNYQMACGGNLWTSKEIKAIKVTLGRKAHKVKLALQVHKGHKVSKGPRGQGDHKGQGDPRDHRDRKAPLDLPALKDRRVRKDHPGRLSTSIV